MKRRSRNHKKKEKIIMLMSSVFVLSALTVTGVYVREKNQTQNDGYIVDLSEMDKRPESKTNEIAGNSADNVQEERADIRSNVLEDDLDYDPNFTEANSGQVENPNLTRGAQAGNQEEEPVQEDGEEGAVGGSVNADNRESAQESGADAAADADSSVAQAAATADSSVAQAVSFSEKDSLQWPISGNVLLNYSMDKTIFFPTLQQYKYNPAIVIEAQPGENITAAATGRVADIYSSAEIGQAVVMDLGSGYELTYGQLADITVKVGDYVSAGDVIATVAKPTGYYSVEGGNVYFKLTKNGTPVNPLGRLS